MTIESRVVGPVAVIQLAGTLGVESAEAFRDKVHSFLFDGHKRFVVNMGRVSHVDSTGLGTLIAIYSSVCKAGGEIVLVSLTQRVAEVMTITKLLTVFDVEDSEALAIVRLSAHRDTSGPPAR